MNYFELHVGDYDAATAHLSMLEDAAYGRMLRIYYRAEKPLPADAKSVCRLVRAQSKAERDAVEAVLQEFFELRADGWHQARCDEELQRYRAGEPERELRKANEEARLERHRKERQALFKLLNENGQHAPWNTKIEELRRLAAPLQAGTETAPATQPATAPATPATATHGNVSPPPTTHYPEKEIPPIAPQGGTPTRKSKPRKPESDREPLCTLATWIAAERAAGRDAIPADDQVFAYAAEVRIPREFLALAWREFRLRYTVDEKDKRYRDWRAVFRKAVRGNWLRLWWLDPGSQQYALTTVGQQAQRAAAAASRPQPPQPDKDAA